MLILVMAPDRRRSLDLPSERPVTAPSPDLRTFLITVLPGFTTQPFRCVSCGHEHGDVELIVSKLHEAIGMSHETVYRWLRTNRMSPRSAQRVVELAGSEENAPLLTRLGQPAPTVEDFSRYVFA